MSIYALPGPLFKLVSNGIGSKEKVAALEVATKDLRSDCVGESSSSSLSMADAAEKNPLHRKPSSRQSSSSTHSQSSFLLDDVSDHSSSSVATSSGQQRGNSNVVIAVKEAKIDPARLIRSLSMGNSSNNSSNGSSDSRKSASGTTDASSQERSSSSSVSTSRRRRSRKHQEDSNECCKCDPHEQAIQFEFSVSFNGREYTATRTLPRILQFRYDLIEELARRRMWRERRRKKKESVPAVAKVRDSSSDEEEEKVIPELPRLSEDAAGSSGFTMLNALLRPYGPALERWMTKVIDIVPHDSQCLTQFLWEPLSGGQAAVATSRKDERRRSSLSTLGAIQETEDLQYDSDTDDYLLNH